MDKSNDNLPHAVVVDLVQGILQGELGRHLATILATYTALTLSAMAGFQTHISKCS